MVPLQLDWVVDPNPPTLPIWLMILGTEALTLAAITRVLNTSLRRRVTLVGGVSLGLGYFFTALSVLTGTYSSYALYLFVLFRTVEGAAAARFYRKVTYVFRTRSLPNSRLRSRVFHLLVIFFIVLVGANIAIGSMQSDPATSWYPPVTVVFTLILVTITGLGVWWRVSQLRGRYALPVLLGFVLAVTGAHMFDYGGLANEIFVSLLGNVAFGAGFWLFIGVWIFDIGPFGSP